MYEIGAVGRATISRHLSTIFGGFLMLASARRVLSHAAQQRRDLAVAGIYAWIRHPRHTAFVLFMFRFLLQ
jgi:methanethiol S-methyltransferase